MQYFRDNTTVLLAVLAILEGVIATYIIRRMHILEDRLHAASRAAEDAARAAALAAPGGIDPEVVIDLIRSGRTATLDTIHDLMAKQDAAPSQ